MTDWNPYPETKPRETGKYLVTFSTGKINISRFEASNKGTGKFTMGDQAVIAWADMPEPYDADRGGDGTWCHW